MRMTTQEIVKHVVGEKEFKNVYRGLHHLLSTNQYRMIRENNTLFLIHIVGKGSGHVQMLSSDEPKTIMRSMLSGLEAMKKAKYKRLYFDTTHDKLPPFLKGNGYTVHDMKNNTFMVEL